MTNKECCNGNCNQGRDCPLRVQPAAPEFNVPDNLSGAAVRGDEAVAVDADSLDWQGDLKIGPDIRVSTASFNGVQVGNPQITFAVRGEAAVRPEFNINDIMVVTLTTDGADVWNKRYGDLQLPPILVPKRVAGGHVLKNQLWELMQVFGPHIGLCRPAMFVGLRMAHSKPFAAPASADVRGAGVREAGPGELYQALIAVREALQNANDSGSGGIVDTLWMLNGRETVFDFIDAALKSCAADALDSQATDACPFCGSENIRVFDSFDEHGQASFGIQCCDGKCSIAGPERGSEAEALDAWRDRPAPASSQPTDGGHAAANCNPATCKICENSYPDIVAEARRPTDGGVRNG